MDMRVYEQSGRVAADSLTEVMKILRQALARLPPRPDGQTHHIILDGVDECEDWPDSKDQLLGSLPKKGSVKIVLFSRVVSNSGLGMFRLRII